MIDTQLFRIRIGTFVPRLLSQKLKHKISTKCNEMSFRGSLRLSYLLVILLCSTIFVPRLKFRRPSAVEKRDLLSMNSDQYFVEGEKEDQKHKKQT